VIAGSSTGPLPGFPHDASALRGPFPDSVPARPFFSRERGAAIQPPQWNRTADAELSPQVAAIRQKRPAYSRSCGMAPFETNFAAIPRDSDLISSRSSGGAA